MNEFPVSSQTSATDKEFILRVRNVFGALRRNYHYVEIGSFMGGSLTPFLLDPYCQSVLSIDERGRAHPDERGINVDYRGVTSQAMLDNLKAHGIPTAKLRTYDHSIETLTGVTQRYDLAFVDGEHTDIACFRDFLYAMPLMNPDAIVMFHDSTLVFKALQIIRIYAGQTFPASKIAKIKDSEMSALFLGAFAAVDCDGLFGPTDDFDAWCALAEDIRILTLFRSRVSTDAPFKLNPIKTLRAY